MFGRRSCRLSAGLRFQWFGLPGISGRPRCWWEEVRDYCGAAVASRSKITSDVLSRRTTTRDLPFGDQENSVILAEVKLVSWLPFDPPSGWSQMLSTP